MKDKLITLLIGAVVFFALCALLALVISTTVGYYVVLGAIVLAASYFIGWFIRDVWRMRGHS
jgi:hypothetical protein